MRYVLEKTMSKTMWDMRKIPQKYNRKAKLHGAVKSIKYLGGWAKSSQKCKREKNPQQTRTLKKFYMIASTF